MRLPPRRELVRVGAGVAVAALFGWLVLGRLEPGQLGAALDGIAPGWVALGIVSFCAGYACRIRRWQAMLAGENPALGWSDCAGPFLLGIAANNLLPLRAGDALRCFGFTRRLGVGPGPVLATLVVERLLDLLVLLVLLLLALAVLRPAGIEAVTGMGLGAVGLAAAAVLAVLLAPRLVRPAAMALLARLARRLPRLGGRIEAEAARIFDVLVRLTARHSMPGLLGWSAAAWVLEGGAFLAAALALPGFAAVSAAVLALPLATLGTLIPSTPGHLGTFDYFAVQAAMLSGEPAASATAYALLVHAMIWLPPVVAGGIVLTRLRPFMPAVRTERGEPS